MNLNENKLLRKALQQKGIGPKGSKKLPPELLKSVLPLLSQEETNRTTAAAFWTACLLLDNSEEEEKLLAPVRQNSEKHLLPELQALTQLDQNFGFHADFLKIIHKLIRRQNLELSEAQQAMEYLWDASIPEWMKGAFLQAERVKRESFQENFVFYDSLWQKTQRINVDLPCLFDLCDSYDGTSRSYHLTPFVAAILGSMGFPAIVHGVESQAPKYGVTNSQILKKSGKSVTLSLAEAKSNLLNPEIGWCYLDQSVFFPELYAFRQLRHDLLKRPFLSAFDKLLQPILNQKGNIVVMGYVHAHYREEMLKLMGLHNKNQMVFNLRTIEGSTNCWGKKPTPFIGYRCKQKNNNRQKYSLADLPSGISIEDFFETQDKELVEGELLPTHFGRHRDDHQFIPEITDVQITEDGLSALQGKTGLVQDLLIFQTAAILWLSQKIENEIEAADRVTETICSGKAWQHWENHA